MNAEQVRAAREAVDAARRILAALAARPVTAAVARERMAAAADLLDQADAITDPYRRRQ